MRRLRTHSGSHAEWRRPHPLHSCASQAELSLSLLSWHKVQWSRGNLMLCIHVFHRILLSLFSTVHCSANSWWQPLVFLILCTLMFPKVLLLLLICTSNAVCIEVATPGIPLTAQTSPLPPMLTDLSTVAQFGFSVDWLISVYANVSTLRGSPHTLDNSVLHLPHTYSLHSQMQSCAIESSAMCNARRAMCNAQCAMCNAMQCNWEQLSVIFAMPPNSKQCNDKLGNVQCALQCKAVQLKAGQCSAPQASGEGISEWLVWGAAVGFPGYLNTEQSLHHPSGQPPMAIA